MKRFFFLHFIALFCLCANAQTTLGWGSIDVRYSQTEVPETSQKSPLLRAWRGERVAAQAVLTAQEELKNVDFTVSDLKSGQHIIPASAVKKYLVRYVITSTFKNKRDSILVADRLEPAATCHMEKGTTQPLWLDIKVPAETVPGTYNGTFTVNCDGKKLSLPIVLQVADRVLPEPSQWSFHLDLWQNPYAVARYFDVPLWSSQHFDKMRPIMQMLAAAGQKVITCSVINRPWNGQTFDHFESMIAKMKQIDGTWKYDYTVFDRWVEFMHSCGINKEITCFSMIPWKLSFRYYDQATDSHKEIKCAPGQKEYAEFWGGMLKAFSAYLAEKGWLDKTFISMDERTVKQMQAAIKVVKDYAPGIKISLAGYYHPEIEKDIYDYCVNYNGHKTFPKGIVERRRSEGKVSTYYTCCSAKYPNLFTFTDPADCEYVALHCLQIDVDGYLRWAYNSWTKEPEKDARFRSWPAGDTHVIYPGNTSSIRWERLVQGVQSFEKWHIMMNDAKSRNDKSMQNKLNKLLEILDINKIANESERMTEEFRAGLNRLSASKKY